ncbi:hypothetical protein [Salinibacterium sp. SWN248]|uniref:hypothetical protein n=1 Tax=Salinibacterium sp. SWN248 TaxID=2792056 RepID=UPI0018CC8439|nr:hypothetical protein [Salinibacterium sp. SWN248]MBH0023811.1 hypothetical protein [Salinibacterium sp. SWN248]
MTKPDRSPIFDSEVVSFHVCYGMRADGSLPAVSLLDGLEEETLPDFDGPARLLEGLEDKIWALCTGEDLPLAAYNYLHDGIWELREKNVRLTYYDTDGIGNFSPKSGERKWAMGQGKNRNFYIPEEMDKFIRLGHWFKKIGQKTDEADLQNSYQVRVEDLEHDKNTKAIADQAALTKE